MIYYQSKMIKITFIALRNVSKAGGGGIGLLPKYIGGGGIYQNGGGGGNGGGIGIYSFVA